MSLRHLIIPSPDSVVPSLSQCFGTLVSVISDLPPVSFFFYKKCRILFLSLPTGEIILSGGKDGLVAVSSPRTGMTIHVLADHKGSPITALQCTMKQVRPHLCPGPVQQQVPVGHCPAMSVSKSASLSPAFPLQATKPSNSFCSVFLALYCSFLELGRLGCAAV